MSKANEVHPVPEQLEAFALGKLDPAEQAEVEQHVASCKECCRLLGGVGDDSLLGHLRAGRTMPGAGGSDTMVPHGAATEGGVDALPELLNHPKYRILRKLGAGGMGEVYHAVHKLMDREVALKVIHPSLTRNSKATLRFQLEVKAAAKLQHPNIVAAHDAEQIGDVHFLVMEYIEGISLDRLVAKNGPLPVEQACHIIRQAALGLQHAHEKGTVHRDVKPHNLMVTRRGQVKVLDFGLALLAQANAPLLAGGKRPLTTLGVILGTPDYIAPEQVSDSHTVDIRADIYSLGCTLYFLLTGQPPFPDGSSLQKALAHADQFPQPTRELRPDLPPELLPILDRMMAKAPKDRYQTPAEAALALTPFARTGAAEAARKKSAPAPVHMAATVAVPVPAPAPAPASQASPPVKPARAEGLRETPRPRRRKRRRNRRWMVLAGIALGLLVLTAGTVFGVRGLLRARDRERAPAVGASQPHLVAVDTPQVPAVGSAGRPRVLIILPAHHFWHPDYAGVRDVLAEANAKVTVAALKKGERILHAPMGGGEPVTANLHLNEAKAADYDAVIICGGALPRFIIEAGQESKDLVRQMQEQNKVVAAVCTGVGGLAKTGALKGKKATGHKRLVGLHEFQNVQLVDEAVVTDGNIVTGRDDKAAPDFARAVLVALRKRA